EDEVKYIAATHNINIDLNRKDIEILPLCNYLNRKSFCEDELEVLDCLFENYRKEIKENYNLSSTIIIPDNLDIFDQKNIIFYYKKYFGRVNPLWRSIAASMASPKIFQQHSKVWVIDGMIAEGTLTLIERRNDKKLELEFPETRGYYYVHRPSKELNDYKNISIENLKINYLIRYFNLTNNDFCANSIYRKIIHNKLLDKVIFEKESVDVRIDEKVFKLDFNKQIFDRCVKLYINDLKSVIKNEGLKQILLINDVLLSEVEVNEIKNQNNCSFYQINNIDIGKGSLEFLKRIEMNLPTFVEYLPNLSLEVINDGRFYSLNLLKDNYIDVFSEKEKEFNISDELILSKDVNEFNFPLYTDDKDLAYKAKLKHPSFPLKDDTRVKMVLTYKYGYENYYDLKLIPINQKNNVEFFITWEKIEKNIIDYKQYIPNFPEDSKESEINNILIDKIDKLKEKLTVFCDKVDSLENQQYGWRTRDINFLSNRLHFKKNAFIVNKALKGNKTAIKFLGGYIFERVNDNLIQVNSYRSMELDNCRDDDYKKAWNRLYGNTQKYYSSFGSYIDRPVYKRIIKKNNLNSFDINLLSISIKNLNEEDSTEIYKFILKMVAGQKLFNASFLKLTSTFIWCRNENVRLFLSDCNKFLDLFDIFLNDRRMSLEKQKSRSNMNNTKESLIELSCVYEIILGLLRLRSEGNNLNERRLMSISKKIKIIDYLLDEGSKFLQTNLKFDVQKPSSLRNMSNLAYVLNGYITCSFGTNLPIISEYEEDEEDEED
nr:hypothetical protein [Melioribacteraceae bacterium]